MCDSLIYILALPPSELQFQLETVRKELATAESDLLTNREEVQLNQERVRELELATPRPRLKTADSTGSALTVDEDDAGGVEGSMGGELDDAMKGTTKTEWVDRTFMSPLLPAADLFAQSHSASSSRSAASSVSSRPL